MDDSYKSNEQLLAEIDELKEKLHKAETCVEEFNSMSKQNEASKNQLLSSEERWKFAIEGNGDGLWDWNPQTNEIFFSTRWKSMLGYEDHEIPNNFEEWDKRVHPDDKTKTLEDIKNHIDRITDVYSNEHRLLCKDGTYKWIIARGKIVSRTDDNKPLRIIGTHSDINKRKQAEEEIRKFKTFTEHALHGNAIVDLEGNLVYINKSFAEIHGYEPNELIGENLSLFHTKEQISTVNKLNKELLEKGFVNNKEVWHVHRNGTEFPMLMSNIVFNNDKGVPEYLVANAIDITERKYAEEELKKQKEIFELVINSVPTRIFWKDLNSVYLGCNSSFAKAAGAKRIEDIIGKNDFDLIWGNEAKRYIDDDQNVLKTGIPKLGYIEDYTLPNGEIVWWQTSKMPLTDNAGNIIGILSTSEDITERKKIEELIVKNKNRLDYALNSIETGAWELDLVKKDSWRSFEHDKIFGYSEPLAEWTYDMFLEHVFPEDREMVDEKFQKAIATKSDWNFECRINRKDGCIRWILASGKHELNKSKEPTKMFGIVQDITERKIAEEAVLKNKERFEKIVELTPIPIIITDVNQDIEYFNNKFSEVFGYTLQDVNTLEEWWPLAYPDEDYRQLVKETWEAAIKEASEKKEQIKTQEWKFVRKDGKSRIVEFDMIPLGDISIITMNDVTDSKQVAETLQLSEEKYRKLYESNQMPISIFEIETLKFLSVNNAFVEKYGYTEEEFLKMTILDIRPESKIEKLKHSVDIDDKGLVNAGVYLHKKKNGEIIYVEIIRYDLVYEGKKAKLVFANDITERKKVENKLEESEEKFRLLYNNSPDMYISVSPDNANILLCNDTLLQNLGYSKEEVIGAPIFEMYHDDCMVEVKEAFQQFVKTGEVNNKELILERKDGSKLDVSLSVYGVRDETGKVIYSMSSLRDITERKQSEEDKKKSEYLLQQAEEVSNQGAWEWDIVQDEWIFSENWLRVHGCQISGIEREELMTIAYPEDAPMIEKAFQDALKGIAPYNLEHRIVRQNDDEVRWIRAIGNIVFNDSGQQVKMYGVARDITDSKNAEKMIQDSKQFYENIIEGVQDGIWVTDENDIIFFANKGMEKIAGVPREQIQGNNILKDFPEETAGELITFYKEAKKETKPVWYDIKVKTPEGRDTWQNGWLIPKVSTGKFEGIICTIRDVTQRKLAENKLKESEEKFISVFDQSPIAIQIYDLDGKLVRVNQKTLDLFGLDDEKYILGFNLWEDPNLSPDKSESLKKGEPIYISASFDFEFITGVIQFPTNRNGIIFLDMYVVPLKQGNEIVGFLVQIIEITEQKQAESLLRDEKKRLRTILDLVGNPIFVKDNDHRITLANQAFYSMFKMDKKDVLGYTLVEAVPENEKHHFLKVDREVLDTGKPDQREEELTIKELTKTIITRKIRFIDESEEKFLVGSIHDITERKKVEIALQQSEEKFRTLIDEMPAGVFLTDVDGKCNYVNPTWSKMGGLRMEEAKNDGWKNGIHPEDRDKVFSNWNKMIESQGSWSFEYRMFDGVNTYWVDGRAKELKNKGKLIGYLGINSDVTERKIAEKELKLSEERFRGIYEQSPVAIELFNKDGKLIDLNQTTLDMFGIDDKKHVLGFDLWADPNLSSEKILLLKSGKSIFLSTEFDFEVIEKHNLYPTNRSGLMYIDMYAIPLMQENENTGYLVQIVEVTERKKAEYELNKHKENLEDLIKERTIELEDKNVELEKFNKLFVGREFRIKELKNKIKELEKSDFRTD